LIERPGRRAQNAAPLPPQGLRTPRNRHHVAVDAEELSTSFAGITTSVVQDTTAHDAARPNGYGRVLFDSPELHAANAQDISIDSRETVPSAS
jgi:hypothetical protein